jgi:putative DNA primase/helicase
VALSDTDSITTDAATRSTREFMRTDTGNAERLVAAHGNNVRYCAQWKSWFCWDGKRWKLDERGRINHLAKMTARAIYREAERCKDPNDAEAFAKWAHASESRDRRAAMVVCAQSEPTIAIDFASLDADPWLLNVANGTIDLRTGKLRLHRREDLITKLAPVAFEPGAVAKRWETFLAEVLPDAEVRAFVQRFAGYCLTGDVSERAIAFLFGGGKNGKSVLLNILRTLVGDYAAVALPDLLMAKRNESHPVEVADLFGARLVICSEVGAHRAFDEAMLKRLTGNEPLKARRMKENPWEFMPTFKIAIAANHEPKVRDDTDSTWDRLHKIPFLVRVETPDKQLFGKLRSELNGVLAWAVRGCLAWQKDGLGVPAAVQRATEEYRAAEDLIGQFFQDLCVFDPDAWVTKKELATAAKKWCEANDEREFPRKDFADRLRARNCTDARTGKRGRHWRGLRLITPAEDAARDAETGAQGDGVTVGDAKCGIDGLPIVRVAANPETATPSVTCHPEARS